MAGKDVLFTPDGGAIALDGKPLERVELRSTLVEWLRQFADFAERYEMGIHCSRCGKDFIGRNADSDATFSHACECREFIGANREYLKPMKW